MVYSVYGFVGFGFVGFRVFSRYRVYGFGLYRGNIRFMRVV